MPNILETAQRVGECNILVRAIQAAGLEGTLAGPGPYTMFAPSDQAFERLPRETVENLLKDVPTLTDFLTNHLVQGVYRSEEVAKRTAIQNVRGLNLPVTSTAEGVKVAEAKVVRADIEADNGVLHMVDRVIVPKGEGAAAQSQGRPPAPGPEQPGTPGRAQGNPPQSR